MEYKNQAVAGRFAENLVGTMLERSGADFQQTSPTRDANVDFLIRHGGEQVAIHVKYISKPENVQRAWNEWLKSSYANPHETPMHQKPKAVDADQDLPHLVIVTGSGETVFTDEVAAEFLGPDRRTSLSILKPPAAIEHLTTVRKK